MAGDLGGYQTGVAYPSQFKAAMTPGYVAGALALQGWTPPDLTRPFRLLDLGCGDGLCAAVAAASHPRASFEGVDGMAAHIEAGRAFPGRPGNLTLTAASFADLAEGEADCDFVTAQGVVAWVSAATRAEVFDIAARRLRPGGVFAVSYNAMPGWAPRLALQRLIRDLAAAEPGDPVARFEAALGRIETLVEAKAAPARAEDVAALRRQRDRLPPAYFAHEYLNEDWRPLWSAEVRAALAKRGLAYAGLAGFDRLRPALTLKAAQREAIARLPAEAADGVIDLFHDTPVRIDLSCATRGRWPTPAGSGSWRNRTSTRPSPISARPGGSAMTTRRRGRRWSGCRPGRCGSPTSPPPAGSARRTSRAPSTAC